MKVQKMNVGQTVEIKVKDKNGVLKEHRVIRTKSGAKKEENLMEV